MTDVRKEAQGCKSGSRTNATAAVGLNVDGP